MACENSIIVSRVDADNHRSFWACKIIEPQEHIVLQASAWAIDNNLIIADTTGAITCRKIGDQVLQQWSPQQWPDDNVEVVDMQAHPQDGRFLVSNNANRVTMFDARQPSTVTTLACEGLRNQLAWSDDGMLIATSGNKLPMNMTHVFDVRKLPKPYMSQKHVRLHPAMARHLAFCRIRGQHYLLNNDCFDERHVCQINP